MRIPRLLFIFSAAAVFSTCSPHPHSLPALEEAINLRLAAVEGDFAVAYKSISRPADTILINPDMRFHAASTMKTPVLIEVYKQAAEGVFSVNDSVLVKNEFRSIVDGSPFSMELSEEEEGSLFTLVNKKSTIYNLAYEMITRSSNFATNLLIDIVDAKKVTQTMRELGADSIDVLRGVEDLKAFDAGLNNTTTARDLLIIFEQLAGDSLISPAANKEMIAILKDQKHNDMFPVKLPPETPAAHKTGWITDTFHDSGIIYTPEGGRFVLVFLSKNVTDKDAALDAAADIAQLVYNYETKQS